jgi:chemotaxis protein methyltransferase CheR
MSEEKTNCIRLIEAIKNNSNYNFEQYSDKSFMRRIEKILGDYKVDIEQLIDKISTDSEFLEQIVKDVTVNTTEIFRDTGTWQVLKHKILAKYKDKPTIDIWHVGCSSGQEVYSTLILLNEMGLFSKTQVIATDINTDVLEVAQQGVYKFREIDEFIENYDQVMRNNPFLDKSHIDIPHQKYFDINRKKNLIKIKAPLLNKPVFLKHDIVTEGNIFDRQFDLIFCRNVLIYFNHVLQNKLFDFFYDNLEPDGALIIGRHEGMLGDIATKFIKEESIYTKRLV